MAWVLVAHTRPRKASKARKARRFRVMYHDLAVAGAKPEPMEGYPKLSRSDAISELAWLRGYEANQKGKVIEADGDTAFTVKFNGETYRRFFIQEV